MISIGITGGLGSGKTKANEIFKELGAWTYDADKIAKMLLEENEDVRNLIESTFGEDIYSSGKLNRLQLAERAFSSKENQQKLNKIIHPAVDRYFAGEMEKAKSGGCKIFCVEAALLFESGTENRYDHVLLISANIEIRLKRALLRGTLSREQILKRMSLQLSEEEKREKAEFILINDGDIQTLRQQCKLIYNKLAENV